MMPVAILDAFNGENEGCIWAEIPTEQVICTCTHKYPLFDQKYIMLMWISVME
jgi:hypothetical protein